MTDQMADRFIAALRTLEDTRDVEPLAALYAEDSQAGNVLAPDHFRGQNGARQFWSEYRGAFGEVESKFRNVIVTDERAALEWITRGTSFDGASLEYNGVTILETAGERVTRSCAYFDPGDLGRQVSESHSKEGQGR